jgi:NAD+ kinase
MPREFKTVGLWGRLGERAVAEPALQVLKHLRKRGIGVFASVEADGNDAFREATRVPERDLVPAVDLVVAVGGDGTLLHAARHVAGRDVPLLGVNRGRLGFLTDISPEHMLQAIDAILAGDYLAEHRSMLAAQLAGRPEEHALFAVNDVVLQ